MEACITERKRFGPSLQLMPMGKQTRVLLKIVRSTYFQSDGTLWVRWEANIGVRFLMLAPKIRPGCTILSNYSPVSFFFAEEEETLHRSYKEVPRKHKITKPPLCTMTASSTRRCRRWRAAAAASLEALDRKQSPGVREVAERRSRRTYTVERRRGQPDAPLLLLQDPAVGAPPPSEPTMGKTSTAPP